MDDAKKIKTLFSIDAMSIISDTEDEKVGEAQVGYAYALNGGFPELALAIAGFLKEIDKDEDIKNALASGNKVGEAFLTLIGQYYNVPEEPEK